MADIQPGAGAPQPSNGMAVASLVLGIVSIIAAIIPFVGLISWILAPLGLIFGFLSMNKPTGRGMAIAGLITSGIGLLICILWVVGLGAAMASASTY